MLSPLDLARLVGLQPALRAAVPALINDVTRVTGKQVRISSGLRSTAEQQYLWDHRATNPYPVAVPGSSFHEFGAAVDLTIAGGTDADYQQLADLAENTYLLTSGYPEDPVHVRLSESLDQAKADWAALQQSRITAAGWLVVVGVAIAVTIGMGEQRRRVAA